MEYFVTVRKDLLQNELSVPIGSTAYYSGSEKLLARWLSDGKFQVFHKGAWLDAESVDFDHDKAMNQ